MARIKVTNDLFFQQKITILYLDGTSEETICDFYTVGYKDGLILEWVIDSKDLGNTKKRYIPSSRIKEVLAERVR